MKQITISTTPTLKEGSNDKGPWLNAYLTDTEGQGWSVFDDIVDAGLIESLRAGDVINVEPKMKDGLPLMNQGRIKVKTFTVITKAAPGAVATPPPLPPPANGGDSMTSEMWAEKDRIKCESIERQSSAATILQFVAALNQPGHIQDPEVEAASRKAIAWLASRFEDAPARSDSDKDWDALVSAGDGEPPPVAPNGLDIPWAVRAAHAFGLSKLITLHSWLKSVGIPPVEGDTIEEVFRNIPADRAEQVRTAIQAKVDAAAKSK